jgi:thymidylate synthase (FAD)
VAVTPEVIAQGSIPVLDHGFVRLDEAMADDLSVVNGARVSFAKHKTEMDDSDAGLIRFLMRERHGCFDDATDVLTDLGWKPWPEIHGRELFATRSIDGCLEYQPALHLVRKEFRGHMLGFKGASIDLLVTPDHRVLANTMTTRQGRTTPKFRLQPAHRVLWKSHRHTATARWDGPALEYFDFDGVRVPAAPFLRLVGFFVGDGNLPPFGNHVLFNLRKSREIAFLERTVGEAGLELKRWGHRHAVPVTPAMRNLFAACYLAGEKVIPRRLTNLNPALLQALWEGLRESDGTVQRRSGADREVFSTTSPKLADGVQILALKLGRSASVRPHRVAPGDQHFGRKPRFRVTVYAPRNSSPALCRTSEAAASQMGVENYNGLIHCVQVPNGTLYVRRNGYPIWSGNTPFEHNAFRFHIRAPIFVAREWFRHRVGSFNEFSMRYAKATDDFYVPEPDDVRTQVGKPGAYSFEPVPDEVAERTRAELRRVYETAFATYEQLVELGVARELARAVLPVGAYTEFYWTVNARALMNFLSLRNAETAQREIRRYAEACEHFFAQRMPVTYQAFVAAGRVSP